MLKQGIVVSLQKYSLDTLRELAQEAINGECVAIKTDKKLYETGLDTTAVIGCHKIKVSNAKTTPYLTHTLDEVMAVNNWANYVSVDYRVCNNDNLEAISNYAKENKINVVADIGTMDDYYNLKEKNYSYTYVASTFSVFYVQYFPDFKILENLLKEGEKNIIAEGNFKQREQIRSVYNMGIKNICIGGAIVNVYKLTRKFTTILI